MMHVLPLVVFVWMAVGAALRFTRTARGKLQFASSFISLSFWATLATSAKAAPSPVWAGVLGASGLVAALALFQWAAYSIRGRLFSWVFSNDVPQFLHTSGPYAYVRNPFYASYLLAIVSTVIMWPTRVGAAIAVAMFFYFHFAGWFEERKFEASPLRAEYEVYRQRTGRLLPRFRRRAPAVTSMW